MKPVEQKSALDCAIEAARTVGVLLRSEGVYKGATGGWDGPAGKAAA